MFCRHRVFSLFFALAILTIPEPALPRMSLQSVDESALHQLIARYFSAFSQKDIETITSLWSAKSPDLEQRKKELQRIFELNSEITVGDLNIGPLIIKGDRADAFVRVEINAIDVKTRKPAEGFGKMPRKMLFGKEEGEWKLMRELSAYEDLAERLFAAQGQDQQNALLRQERELVTVELRKSLDSLGEREVSKGQYRPAIAYFLLAQVVGEQIDDKKGVIEALNDLGIVYRQQGDYDQALQYHQRALALSEAVGDKGWIASSLNSIGNIYNKRGERTLAIAQYERVLALCEEMGMKRGIASSSLNLGSIYAVEGDLARAMSNFQKSLSIQESLGNQREIANALRNIGYVQSVLGNYDSALEYLRKTLKIREELGDKSEIANTLNAIGEVYFPQGDYGQALDYYQKALAMDEALGEKSRAADVLYNIGRVHAAQGNEAQALAHYERVLRAQEDLKETGRIATLLNAIGELYLGRGDLDRAEEFFRRSLAMRDVAIDKGGKASTLLNIGQVNRLRRDYRQATELFQQSLELSKELGNNNGIAEALRSLGQIRYEQQGYSDAAQLFDRAAETARQVNDREQYWEARAAAGRAYRALGEHNQERRGFEDAIATIEDLRPHVAGDEQERERFFERRVSPYCAMVELLARQDPGSALSYAERAKARVLLDVLRDGRAKITKSMTDAERATEQRLRDALVSLNAQLSREGQRKSDPRRLEQLRGKLETARLSYEDFQSTLYAAHPELKVSRGESLPFKVNEAKALLPDSNTALVEYVVTDDNVYLFVLTKSAQKDGVDLRLYTLPTRRKELSDLAEEFRRLLASRDLAFRATAGKLYDLLLKPAHGQLAGKTKLVIVPDDKLWDLPFQALLTESRRYLIEQTAISYCPSLIVLREMIARAKERDKANTESALLALGNPDLGKDTLERATLATRDESLAPLPETETQVRLLSELYGARRSRFLTGRDAREDRFKAEAANFKILHLATHGVLNDASPMYSHLVLSQGDSKEDGLLEAWELMNMELNADLVVLSACETARGRVSAGEGVIGLSWALFVAGSPSMVVSQWKVDSSSTTELMLEFHRNLKSGTTKGDAIRQAAIKLISGKRYSHPFYWAGFIVLGNPN